MAVPIQRYSDPRLLGTFLARPFERSYQWMRPVTYPRNPYLFLVHDIASRLFKAMTALPLIALSTPLFLIGRAIQVLHYHAIDRRTPQSTSLRDEDGTLFCLPLNIQHQPVQNGLYRFYEDDVKHILLNGWSPKYLTNTTNRFFQALYLTHETGSVRLHLSFDIKENEVAVLTFRDALNLSVHDKSHQLFLQNGYRAIVYSDGKRQNLVVLDPAFISIRSLEKAQDSHNP